MKSKEEMIKEIKEVCMQYIDAEESATDLIDDIYQIIEGKED